MGITKILDGHISIINHINIDEIEESINAVENQLNNVNGVCIKYIKECSEFVENSHVNYRKLISKVDIIHSLLGTHKYRVKRGLINIIGSGLKGLFGTMDNDDAVYYDNVISTVIENQEFIQNGLKEEVKIMKSLNEKNQILKNNYHILETKNEEIITKINGIILTIDENNRKQGIINYLRSLQFSIFNRLFQFELELEKVVDAILFLQAGTIHPIVITPEKFIEVLKDSKNQEKLLYTPSLESYHVLIKDVKIKAFEKNGIINIILSVPILKEINIEAYEILTLPFKVNDNQWSILEFDRENKILLISKNKENFILKNNLNECNKISNNDKVYFICPELVLESTLKHEICEVNVFMKRSNKYCNLKLITNELEIFYKLNDLKYIFVTSNRKLL